MDKLFINGQRYLFHETTPWGEVRQYRANFIEILGEGISKQITSNCVETEYSKSTIMSTPYSWITKMESLDDVVSQTIIPRDVLFIIDSYL